MTKKKHRRRALNGNRRGNARANTADVGIRTQRQLAEKHVSLTFQRMSTVQEIEEAIERLSAQDVDELRAWLFDRDIARDSANGLLDELANEAINEVRDGRAKPL